MLHEDDHKLHHNLQFNSKAYSICHAMPLSILSFSHLNAQSTKGVNLSSSYPITQQLTPLKLNESITDY